MRSTECHSSCILRGLFLFCFIPTFLFSSCCVSFSLFTLMCPSPPPFDLPLTSTLLLVFPTFQFVSFSSALALRSCIPKKRSFADPLLKPSQLNLLTLVHFWSLYIRKHGNFPLLSSLQKDSLFPKQTPHGERHASRVYSSICFHHSWGFEEV